MDYIKVHTQEQSYRGSNLFLCRERWGYRISRSTLMITDRTLPFSGQLQNIQRADVAVIQEVLPDDATAVFGAIP